MIISRMTVDEIEAWHERRFRLFAEDNRCDLLGCETITGSKEIEALLRLMKKYPKDCYLSLACAISGPKELNSREPWDEVFQMIANNKPPSLKAGIHGPEPVGPRTKLSGVVRRSLIKGDRQGCTIHKQVGQ